MFVIISERSDIMKYTPHELKMMDKWIEKGITKHKHDFSVRCVYEQRLEVKPNRDNVYHIKYYDVLMCNACHSFVTNDKKDGWGGYIGGSFSNEKTNPLKEEYRNLPRIIGSNYNGWCNISHASVIYFPDGTIWRKK